MKHKGLLLAVSLGLAGIVFVVVWLLGGILWGAAIGGAVFLASVLLVGVAYIRSTRVIKQQQRRFESTGEPVLYADIAGFMDGSKEYTGAMLVTARRLVFYTPPRRKGGHEMEIPLEDIALAQDASGYFRLAAGGRDMRFKVFRCEVLVRTIHGGIGALGQEGAALVEGPNLNDD